jgi:hypothetical protein
MTLQLPITQYKRFVRYGTHPNFCYAKTSFMLGTLYEMVILRLKKDTTNLKVENWSYMRVNQEDFERYRFKSIKDLFSVQKKIKG